MPNQTMPNQTMPNQTTRLQEFFEQANRIAEQKLKVAKQYVENFQRGDITYTELGQFLIRLHESEVAELQLLRVKLT